MQETTVVDNFLNALDEFAVALDPAGQAMLAAMVGASETSEVAGFGSEPWPGVRNVLGPIPIARVGKEAESWVGYEDVASVIGGWGEGGKK